MRKKNIYIFNTLAIYCKNFCCFRRNDQLNVWCNVESPLTLREEKKMQLNKYDNMFNMTMIYK